jgi:hypothetical protein
VTARAIGLVLFGRLLSQTMIASGRYVGRHAAVYSRTILAFLLAGVLLLSETRILCLSVFWFRGFFPSSRFACTRRVPMEGLRKETGQCSERGLAASVGKQYSFFV